MIIDAHVHVWDLGEGRHPVDYPWLTRDLGAIYRTFKLAEVRAEMDRIGIGGLVLVQAADSMAETRALLRVADGADRPTRVVGWLPLADPVATAALIGRFRRESVALVGVRHLIHDDPDPRWMLQLAVAESLDLLAAARLTFDAVAERPDLLDQVVVVARRHPGLTVVLDHLGKPPIAERGWQPWADQIAAAAAEPNVVAKISGLNTASLPGWSSDDWRPYVSHALAVFGSERLMVGGDWPVSLLAGSFAGVWSALVDVLDGLPEAARQHILWETAARVYRFHPPPTVVVE